MKILVFSDIHGDCQALERLLDIEADHYFAAGDLVTWARGYERIGPILARRAGRMHVLPGNHESEEDVSRLCAAHGLEAFHGKSLRLEGYHVAGFGYSNPTPFNTPGEYSEQEIARRLEAFATLQPLILICHCPPYGTPLDRVGEGRHCGSTALRRWVERVRPVWLFCGHIHEAEGTVVNLGPTRAASPGRGGYLLDFATLKT